MKPKYFFIILGLTLFSLQLSAQEDIEIPRELMKPVKNTPKKRNNFLIGGSFGATFGTYTSVDVAPHFGYYLIKDHLLGGGGLNYTFVRERYLNTIYDFHILGGSLLLQGYFLRYLCAHAELNYYGYKDNNYLSANWLTAPALYVGGGYRQKVGGDFGVYFLILFNCFSGHPNNIYGNPIFRAGFSYDF